MAYALKLRVWQFLLHITRHRYFREIALLLAFIFYVHYYLYSTPYYYKTKAPPRKVVTLGNSYLMPETGRRLDKQRENATIRMSKFLGNVNAHRANFSLLTTMIRPEVMCNNLIRFGSRKDGGHWVCNPHTFLKNPCLIYSIGIDDNLSFETGIQNFMRIKCSLYAYDKFNSNPETKAYIEEDLNGRYQQVSVEKIAAQGVANSKGLSDLFIENGHSTIDVLKVDQPENLRKFVGSVAGLYDIHHILATHTGRADYIIKYLATMNDLHYSLYSWEFDSRRPNTVTTSHIANRQMDASEFGLYKGQYYNGHAHL